MLSYKILYYDYIHKFLLEKKEQEKMSLTNRQNV